MRSSRRSSRLLALLAVLLAPATSAAGMIRPAMLTTALQGPPSPHSSSEAPALPPMSSAQPLQATPPMVTAPGPSPSPYTDPSLSTPAYAPTSLQVATPSDRYGVAVPPRRTAWGEGSTMIRRDARVGVYIGPTFKLTGFNRSPGLLLGADFAVILGERFAIGLAGSALVTPLAALRDDGRSLNLRTQYAGVTLRVALVRVKFWTLGVGGLVGGGRACLNDERLDRCVNRAAMFVAEPELAMTFAVTRVLRLVLAGGYRVVVAQSWSGPSDHLLGGLTGTLGFQLGKF